MQALKILHSEVSTGWGGQEIRIFTEMQAMRERGHTLYLATTTKTTLSKRCTESEFPILHFNDKKLSYPTSILKVASFLRKEKIDVVNTHSSRDGWIVGLAARLAKVPLVIRSRHIDVSYPNVLTSRIVYGKLADHVITTSDAITRGLVQRLRLDSDKVHTIATGIDLNRYDPTRTSTLRSELNIGNDVPIVGMISVLRSWKGHEYFIEAARILRESGANIQFIIVGGGPGEERIRNIIQSKHLEGCVKMLGHRNDVPNILAGVDCVVLPSTAHEGIPQILLQAMAMSKPIVGTTVGGIPEVVEDEKNGLLVRPESGEEIAEALRRLQATPEWAIELGKNGRERAIHKHSVDGMCDTLETLYAQKFK